MCICTYGSIQETRRDFLEADRMVNHLSEVSSYADMQTWVEEQKS